MFRRAQLVVLTGFLVQLPLPDHSVLGAPAHLIDFRLYDQFERLHTRRAFQGKVVILIGADRKGSKISRAWGHALFARIPANKRSQVRFLPVADLSVAPRMFKALIKLKFPRPRREWILMDWRGLLPRTYGFKSGHANVVLFDRTGRVIHRAYGRSMRSQAFRELAARLLGQLQ